MSAATSRQLTGALYEAVSALGIVMRTCREMAKVAPGGGFGVIAETARAGLARAAVRLGASDAPSDDAGPAIVRVILETDTALITRSVRARGRRA